MLQTDHIFGIRVVLDTIYFSLIDVYSSNNIGLIASHYQFVYVQNMLILNLFYLALCKLLTQMDFIGPCNGFALFLRHVMSRSYWLPGRKRWLRSEQVLSFTFKSYIFLLLHESVLK